MAKKQFVSKTFRKFLESERNYDLNNGREYHINHSIRIKWHDEPIIAFNEKLDFVK